MSAVRTRLVGQVRAALLGLDGVGVLVLAPDEALLPEAVPGEGPVLVRGDGIGGAEIQKAVKSGAHALEVVFSEEASEASNAFEGFELFVTVVVHLAAPGEGQAGEDQAAEFCALIHGLYGSDLSGSGGAAHGDPQWTDSGGPLAVDTRCEVFCAGVGRDEVYGTRITVHSFVATYRFARGDPGVAR